jgi:hypothetical protein
MTGEAPTKGERGMLASIRVRPAYRGDAIFPSSRINYAKLYTVEHNVKVYEFGDVHEKSLPLLKSSWDYVFRADLQGRVQDTTQQTYNPQPAPSSTMTTIIEGVTTTGPGEPPIHGTTTSPWYDTTHPNQLHFETGARIYVTEHLDDSWSKGRNESTRLEGSFPRGYVTLDSPDIATAQYDQKYDKKYPKRMAFNANDRILCKKYVNDAWDFGLNYTTGKEGEYPYQYVKMDRGTYAIAKRGWKDEGNAHQLKYSAKDRILVTYYSEDINASWWGRNERTRREGAFPGTEVKFDT